MSHLFFSYSRRDEAMASRVAAALREQGIEVWQDISGKGSGIPFSTKWFEVIEEALYSASGAVVFDTDAWRASTPCAQEFALIQKNDMPCLAAVSAFGEDPDRIIAETLAWHAGAVENEENEMRTWLFTRAHSYRKSKRGRQLVPRARRLREARDLLEDLRDCRRLAAERHYAEKNPEIAPAISGFLSLARRRTIAGQLFKALGVLFGAAAVVTAIVGAGVLPQLLDQTDAAYRADAVLGTARDVAEYDPVAAMSILSSPSWLDPAEDLFSMQRMMVALEGVHFPAAFYGRDTAEAAGFRALPPGGESPRFTVSPSATSGRLLVHDAERGTTGQVLVACAPADWAIDGDGRFLAVAAANKAYLWDLAAGLAPMELAYNHEDIERIGFAEGQVYALTAKGNVVLWDNPVLARQADRGPLSDGTLFTGADGRVAAAYIDGTNLILDDGGGETEIPLPADGSLGGQVAVSPDGRSAAVPYTPADSPEDHVLIVDLAGRAVLADHPAGSDISGLAFSADGGAVLAACIDGSGIVRIDLADGGLAFSEPSGAQNTLVARCGDTYLATDAGGWATRYDAGLNQMGDPFRVARVSVPLKQIAIAEEQGYVFTANRGGNQLSGCARTRLSDHAQHIFLPAADDSVVSSTAVALSPDGQFVAFGYPNGQVCVWDASAMNLVWSGHHISESICALALSAEGQVHALGASGSLYALDAGPLAAVPGEDGAAEYWKRYTDEALEIHRKMVDLGLTCIAPEAFIQ